MTTEPATRLNGLDVHELRTYIASVVANPTLADRHPEVVARWVGGTRAEVVGKAGGAPVFMGGDEDPSAMGMLLRALAACDVEVLVTRATLLGIEIESLSIEATGYFNVARYLGVDSPDHAGYQRASYAVSLRAPGATPEQLDELRQALETSPAGETFSRNVAVTYQLTAG